MAERTKCEVFARVVGYIRPVENYNEGKKAEYYDRVVFDVSDTCTPCESVL